MTLGHYMELVSRILSPPVLSLSVPEVCSLFSLLIKTQNWHHDMLYPMPFCIKLSVMKLDSLSNLLFHIGSQDSGRTQDITLCLWHINQCLDIHVSSRLKTIKT